MSVKWIIADIDGCITPEESVPWDLDLFWKLARISRDASEGRGRNAPLTLCTGRPQPYVEVLAKLLDIRAPIICESGAVLYTMHDNRSRYGPGVTNEKMMGLRAVRAFLEAEILPYYPDVVYQFGKEAHMSVFSQKPQLFNEIVPRIKQFVERRGGPDIDISPSHYYLNISLRGVDKGRTLHALCGELGVEKKDVAGIGDTEGDLPLRDAVAFFACPSNAKTPIKEAADYVSPFPTLEGVLDILSLAQFARE
ncbi:MAG: HAD hydrolase family protein [Candidatus Hydrogenedentes bacterium]|nr:HAD hydrolase family protein [Candidatus Hydrogenedentota bacterium]